MRTRPLLLLVSTICLSSPLALLSSPAQAADAGSDVATLRESVIKQEALIKKQNKILAQQREKLAKQEKDIADNRAKLEVLLQKVGLSSDKAPDQFASLETQPQASSAELKNEVGAGKPSKKKPTAAKEATKDSQTSAGTSIIAPPQEEKRPEIAMLADQGGVLTPKGVLMYENGIDYINTTNNLFTFNGVQVSEVVFVGITNATTAKRQVIQDNNRFRLGLTNRLEADVRIPYVYRNDTTSETNTSTSVTTRRHLEGNGIGDIDGGLAYQINQGKEGWPFLVGNLRYKANNADGPFDVAYDADGIAKTLPTGTGYHSVEGSLTAIKVTDPAVLFSNIGYVRNFESDINKSFGNTKVISFNPGDAVNVSAGMGFSINPETSFTLGYKHSYVFPTIQHNQKISTGEFSKSESDSASVGALMVGGSYRLSPITSLNLNVEVGATADAPDVRVGFRIPIRLGQLF